MSFKVSQTDQYHKVSQTDAYYAVVQTDAYHKVTQTDTYYQVELLEAFAFLTANYVSTQIEIDFRLPVGSSFTLSWGDGSTSVVNGNGNVDVRATSSYTDAGSYGVELSGSYEDITLIDTLVSPVGGSVSGWADFLTSLVNFTASTNNTFFGSIARMVTLTNISLGGGTVNVSGSITDLVLMKTMFVTGINKLSGSPEGMLSGFTQFRVQGQNTIAYDLNDTPVSVVRVYLTTCNIDTYTAGHDWSNLGLVLFTVNPRAGYGLDSTEMDNLLIDMNDSLVSNMNIVLLGSNSARTAASDTAVAGLLGRGCTVTTNP